MENRRLRDDPYIKGMDWSDQDITLSAMKNYRRYQFNLIKKFVGTNILEVGSGDRGFTKQIIENVSSLERLISIEPSITFFERFKDAYNFPKGIIFDNLDIFNLDVGKYGRFDTVIFIHVLEHIEDDYGALSKCHDLLENGGRILIEVPALPFLYSVHDEMLGHHRRYTKKMLKKIVNPELFAINKIFYNDLVGIFGSLIFFKLRKTNLNSNKGRELVTKQGSFYDKFIIPFEERLEKYITPPIGLSLTLILTKKGNNS